MDLKNIASALSQITDEKGIPFEKVLESIETALAAAYKKDYGKKGQIIKAKFDPNTGDVQFWQVKTAVTKEMIYSEEELLELGEEKEGGEEAEGKIRFNEEKHIMLEEAKKQNKKIEAGEELEIPLES